MKYNIPAAAFAILVSLWAALAADAQSGVQVTMKIDLVAWGEAISGLSLKSATGKSITAQAFRYSKPITYSGPVLLEIFRTDSKQPAAPEAPVAPEAAPAAAPAPEAIKAAVGSEAWMQAVLATRRKDNPNLVSLAMLPATSRHVTILLAPAASGTFLAYVIDDDPSKLPLGKLRIHNLSQDFVAMRCNNETTSKLKNKESVVVAPKEGFVVYALAYEKEGEWVTQESSFVSVKDDEQAQLVVLKSDASFFTSQDGSRSGYLQTVVLLRSAKGQIEIPEMSDSEKAALLERVQREEEQMAKDAVVPPKPSKPSKP